jgi:hypothetical protein
MRSTGRPARDGIVVRRCMTCSSPARQCMDKAETEAANVVPPAISVLVAVRVCVLSWKGTRPASGFASVLVMASGFLLESEGVS